jgi:hypothetical protein
MLLEVEMFCARRGPAPCRPDVTAPIQTGSLSGVAGVLADGYYQLVLSRLDVPSLTSDYRYQDFVLAGDADHNASVDYDDYVALDEGMNSGGTLHA